MNFGFDVLNDTEEVQPYFSMDDEERFDLSLISVEEFAKKFFLPSTVPVGLLPPAIRWCSADRKTVVFERPPARYYIEVAWAKQYEAAEAEKFVWEIPVPWTCYIVFFDFEYNPVLVRSYFRPAPLQDWTDPVYMMPLFNQYLDSSLCKPVVDTWEIHDATISWGVQEAFNQVWNSGFNLDLVDTINQSIQCGAVVSPEMYTRAKLHQDGDDMRAFFNAWQTMSIKEVMEAPMMVPSIQPNGYEPYAKLLSIGDAVAMVQEASHAESGGINETISRLVGSF